MNNKSGKKWKRYNNEKKNNLTFIEIAKRRGKDTRYLCKCDCGNIINISSRHFGRTKSCGCIKMGRPRKIYNCEDEYTYAEKWRQIQRNAKSRNLKFNISKKYVWNLYIKQNKKCAISKKSIFWGMWSRDEKGKRTWHSTASLDRIDSSKGYIKGNVQWIHKDINTMKWDFDQEYFIKLCKTVAKEYE